MLHFSNSVEFWHLILSKVQRNSWKNFMKVNLTKTVCMGCTEEDKAVLRKVEIAAEKGTLIKSQFK